MFHSIFREALRGYSPSSYQNTGVDAVYRAADLSRSDGLVDQSGEVVMNVLQRRFPDLRYLKLPDHTVYPWAWNELENIWDTTRLIPKDCIGIHWFGAARVSQEINNVLTPENMHEYPNTFTRYAEPREDSP